MVEVAEGAQSGEKEGWGNLISFFQGQYKLCHSMLDPMPCSASPHIPALPFIPRHRLEEGQASSWTRRLKVFLCCTRTKDSQSVGTKNSCWESTYQWEKSLFSLRLGSHLAALCGQLPFPFITPFLSIFSCCFHQSHSLKEENLEMGKQKPGRSTKILLNFLMVKNYSLIHRSM